MALVVSTTDTKELHLSTAVQHLNESKLLRITVEFHQFERDTQCCHVFPANEQSLPVAPHFWHTRIPRAAPLTAVNNK
jgi:hypothetical protein